jgi:DNA/RNA endonuclease G (NUC1)
VAVPVYFYKIILVRDQSTWKAIAFVLPNTDFKQPHDLKSYIASIEWIETLTGIEFIPRMSASDRRKLISEASAMWP